MQAWFDKRLALYVKTQSMPCMLLTSWQAMLNSLAVYEVWSECF